MGTLEPCLDKTSHSPLVRATSSLMGHLNSSVRKQSRGVRDAGRDRLSRLKPKEAASWLGDQSGLRGNQVGTCVGSSGASVACPS